MPAAFSSLRLLLGATVALGSTSRVDSLPTLHHSDAAHEVAAHAPAGKKRASVRAARVLTIVARDYAFEAPDTIAAGLTEVRLLNRGAEMHHAYLIRLDSGKRLEDLLSALGAGGPLPAWTHDVGGPNARVPGATSAAVVDLSPGTYALICVIPSTDGKPHVMKGMAHTFTAVSNTKSVSETAVRVGAPDATIDLSDYNFALSRPLTRGHHVIRVRNSAAQSHEAFVARLAPGKSPTEVLAWLESPKGPPPFTPLGGTVGLARGVTNDIALDLVPGEYALLCFIPDAKDGKPHVAHGMVRQFTVR